MLKFTGTILILLLTTAMVFSQNDHKSDNDKEAIKQAALDYMEGAHEGDAARIERGVHPELCKISVRILPQTGKSVLYKAGFTRLRELVRANVAPLEKEQRNIEVTIYSIKEGLACAKAVSPMFYDYLHLAKIAGQWKLINVLWTWNPTWQRNKTNSDQKEVPTVDPEIEKKAIKNTALDYIEGYFSGDVERMARAVHPELNKVIPATVPQTGKMMLNYSSASMLIEGTRAKLGLLEEEKRNIEVIILDLQKEIALVEVVSAMYYDYLQLAKVNGEWKIVNVLWKMNPDAPKRKS